MTSGLKNSNRQNKFPNENITIDAKHSEMISHFKNLKDSIPSLKDELKKLINEYNKKDPTRKNDIEYILYRDSIKDKIYELKDRINKIINNDDINKYYLEVGTLLHNYYENIENSKTNENIHSENFEENLLNYDNYFDLIDEDDDDDEIDNTNEIKKNKDNNSKNKNILNFFNTNSEENDMKDMNDIKDIKENIDSKNNSSSAYTSTKISDFVKEESNFKKKDILDEYLQKIDPKYISKIKIDHTICKCSNCNNEMTLFPSDGIQICEGCGYQQHIFIESDKPSFKDPPMEVCYFSYKRINHFNEFDYKRQKTINEYFEIYNLLKNLKKMIFNNLYIF
jgi:hypothetical protein